MTKILPFICYEHDAAISYLIDFFKPHLVWGATNFFMDRWVEMMDGMSVNNARFKTMLIDSGLVASAIEHV
jgi:hypothetical protein